MKRKSSSNGTMPVESSKRKRLTDVPTPELQEPSEGPSGKLSVIETDEEDDDWDQNTILAYMKELRDAFGPLGVREEKILNMELKVFDVTVEGSVALWKDGNNFEGVKQLMEMEIEMATEEARLALADVLRVVKCLSPRGLVELTEKALTLHLGSAVEKLPREEKWKRILASEKRKNRKLRAAFSNPAAVPQMAVETMAALEKLGVTNGRWSHLIIIPRDLTEEQQRFIITLCDFNIIGYELKTRREIEISMLPFRWED